MEDTLVRSRKLVLQLKQEYDEVVSRRRDLHVYAEHLEQLASACDRLDMLANKEPADRRPMRRLDVDQIRFDYQTLCRNLDGFRRHVVAQETEERQREELMQRQFTHNSQETSLLLGRAMGEHSSLQSSSQNISNLIEHGQSILANLKGQRSIMKNAHRKMLDVLGTLGLSNTVMRLVERRSSQDKLILFGGMVAVLLFMFFFYRWYHG